ncbi:MAG: hypothetical protein LBV28_00220, partial [Puniceicoccales bacterium]|nr:hypothetical protein [Puniceicoccales bacterium]
MNKNLRLRLRALTLSLALLAATPATYAATAAPNPTAPTPTGTTISLHATVPPATTADAPAFAAATLNQAISIHAGTDGAPHTVAANATLNARVFQGEVSRFTFAFTGKESIGAVSGENVASWETRRNADGVRLLDIFTKTPLKPNATFAATITFAAYTLARRSTDGAESAFAVPVLSLLKNDTTAAKIGAPAHIVLDGTVQVSINTKPAVKLHSLDALLRVTPTAADGTDAAALHFIYDTTAETPALLRFTLAKKEAATFEKLELFGNDTDGGLFFTLETTIRVHIAGAVVPILRGPVAVLPHEVKPDAPATAPTATPAANAPRLILDRDGYAYQFDAVGEYPISLRFVAQTTRKGDATSVHFAVPGVPIARLLLDGFPVDAHFITANDMPALKLIRIMNKYATYASYLSPDGDVSFTWTRAKAAADARLFFSTNETTDIVVRPGLLRQSLHYRYQILQGKLDTLRFALSGNGEILRVTGADVLSWKVEEAEEKEAKKKSANGTDRVLVVRLAQPKTTDYALNIDAQTPLGDFPLDIAPLALAPQDVVRHSGFVQVINEGAVRLESTPRAGLTQVAPALFPSNRSFSEATQRFVYRVAGAQTALSIHADNILPEVNVSALALYRITESDLFIDLEAELDVREAPLQEITLSVPAGYTVSQTEQLDEWSYTLGAEKDGQRSLRLNFTRPLTGRNIIKFRLEQSRTAANAATPALTLAPVTFPSAKSVRGNIGVVAAPGLRVAPVDATGVTEIATAFFPRRTEGLQQAYRLRDPAWRIALLVGRLDLAVQSDALHLFAVREGLVSASTTVNYAIVGAPLGEFRFSVPAEVRNLEFAGKDIRAWKRDGDTLTISLHKPVSGAFTLLGTYDLPLDPRGGVVSLTGLRPLEVQTEQGFVLVTSDLQFNVKNDTVSPNLTPVETGEIPAEYRMMFDAPLLAAYQYAARPYDLKLGLQLRPQSNTLNQVVDFASLSTRVSHDGQIVTEARYLVKSHGHPHLRLTPPAGLKLWTARVDNTDVLPVTDAATTLIPLPARPDANTLLTVDLRFAGNAADVAKIRLDAPALGAPIINTRWEVTPDKDTTLNAIAGNLAQEKTYAPPPPDFWNTRAGKLLPAFGAVGAVAMFGALLFSIGGKLRNGGRRKLATAFGAIGAVALIGAVAACWQAIERVPAPPKADPSAISTTLVFTSPIHLGSEGAVPHFLELRRETAASPIWAILGHVALLAIGAVVALGAVVKKSAALRAVAWTYFAVVLFAAGDSHLGWLATLLAVFLLVEVLLPGLRCFRANGTGTVALLALALFAGHAAAADIPYHPEASQPVKLADEVWNTIRVSNEGISGQAQLRIRGDAGDRFDLLTAPAVLIGTTNMGKDKDRHELPDGTRLVQITRNGKRVTQLVLEKALNTPFEIFYEINGTLKLGQLTVPTGLGVRDSLSVILEAPDLAITSDAAATYQYEAHAALTEKEGPITQAEIVFLPRAERTLHWAAKARDRRTESPVIYAESSDLYVPSLGVLDGRHTLRLRTAQGLLREVNVHIPAGLSVANVNGTGVRNWRFDPEKQRLTIPIEPAQANETTLTLETQMGIGALPQKLTLAPLTVEGTAGQVGMIALGTADDVQITTATPQKMLAVANDDFQQNATTAGAAV